MLGMAVAVETVKPEWRDPEFGHRLHRLRSLRQQHPHRPLVVAVGSSRTQMGFSPAAMTLPDEPGSPLVFNCGQAGAGPLHLRLTLERLLDAGVKPDFLLVEFFPAAFAGDGAAEDLVRPIVNRLSLADVRHLEPYSVNPTRLRREWAAARLNTWHTSRLVLMSHWKASWLPWQHRFAFQWEQMDPFGFTPYPHEVMPPGEREAGLLRVREQYGDRFGSFHVGRTSDRAMRDLLMRCREVGIRVGLYPMPESPAFTAWFSPETRTRAEAYRDGLAREFGAAVFDATAGFSEDDFADGHHMLRHAAARFSRRLAEEHLEPWVRGK